MTDLAGPRQQGATPAAGQERIARPDAGDALVIGRIGHYRTGDGLCYKADVAFVHSPGLVNLAVTNHDGSAGTPRTSVRHDPDGGLWAFHLNRECPEGR